MATRITGGTLTVTVTESLTMTHATSADNRSHSQTMTKTFGTIDNLEKRVLNLPNTNQVEVASFGSTAATGLAVYKRSSVAYIRITNLDDTNGVAVILEDTGGDMASVLVVPGGTLMLTDTQVEGGNTGADWAAWANIDQIFLKAAATNVQVEIVVATTA